jgi:hypothetical protein
MRATASSSIGWMLPVWVEWDMRKIIKEKGKVNGAMARISKLIFVRK